MENVLAHVLPVLSATPMRWNELAEALPEPLMARLPAPGQWSALECLLHLIDTEHVLQSRLAAFRAGADFPAFDPATQGSPRAGRARGVLADEFAELRAESLRQLALLAPEDLDLVARHGELGPVTLDEMLHEWAAHDLNHTVQAERALMQPYLEGCGPWRKYFADHDAGQ